MSYSPLLAGLAVASLFVCFGLISLVERETRAAVVAFVLAVMGRLPFVLIAIRAMPTRTETLAALSIAGLAAAVLWFLPIGTSHPTHGRPTRRVDERDIMFARARLEPGSESYRAYYAMRPENKESDDRTRALPGLLSSEATRADPVIFAAARASFSICSALRNDVDGPVAANRCEGSATDMTAVLKRVALDFGACDVGVTELRPYHVYSHVGRGSGTWGEPIDLDHRWAIAFTVEMDYHAMRRAPAARSSPSRPGSTSSRRRSRSRSPRRSARWATRPGPGAGRRAALWLDDLFYGRRPLGHLEQSRTRGPRRNR